MLMLTLIDSSAYSLRKKNPVFTTPESQWFLRTHCLPEWVLARITKLWVYLLGRLVFMLLLWIWGQYLCCRFRMKLPDQSQRRVSFAPMRPINFPSWRFSDQSLQNITCPKCQKDWPSSEEVSQQSNGIMLRSYPTIPQGLSDGIFLDRRYHKSAESDSKVNYLSGLEIYIENN